MDLRQSVNQRPKLVASIAIIAIVGAGVFCWYFYFHHANNKISDKCYYCDENGKNVFIDDSKNVPPFAHNGTMAYRAIVMKCVDPKDPKKVTKPPFVLRLEGYDDDTKQMIEQKIKQGIAPIAAQEQYNSAQATPIPSGDPRDREHITIKTVITHGKMIKKPGETKWYTMSDVADWNRIMTEPNPPEGPMVPVSVEEDAHP